jgi:hypothetical protein
MGNVTFYRCYSHSPKPLVRQTDELKETHNLLSVHSHDLVTSALTEHL